MTNLFPENRVDVNEKIKARTENLPQNKCLKNVKNARNHSV